MCSLFCEHFCPEAFPYLNRKFIKRRYSGNEGDTGRSGNPEIELFSNPLIRNISYPMRQAGRTFYVRFFFRRVRTQEIGRASGWERMEISVGAVSFKKNMYD